MGSTTWDKAVFLGPSDDLGGFQQGRTYTIRVEWPGLLYPYRVVSQELGEATASEYLDKPAILADWRWHFQPQEGGPSNG